MFNTNTNADNVTYKIMSNNKQSSVEWLMEKLIEHQIIKVGQTTYGGKVNYKHEILLEQAKALHKEEIVNACNLQRNDYKGMPTFNKSGEQYYNETFGGNNED